MQSNPWLKLRIPQVEKASVQVATDPHRILLLDGIDPLPDLPGFRIRSHDAHGPLPEILIKDTGDGYPVLDAIRREAAKLYAIVRVRDDIAAIFPGCKFLLPTRTDEWSVVGIRFAGRTVVAEHRHCWEAYHKLVEEAVRRIL